MARYVIRELHGFARMASGGAMPPGLTVVVLDSWVGYRIVVGGRAWLRPVRQRVRVLRQLRLCRRQRDR